MAGNMSRELGELTVKVNVEVAEALTGLKAIQREAKKAVQALRELESIAKSVRYTRVGEIESFEVGGD